VRVPGCGGVLASKVHPCLKKRCMCASIPTLSCLYKNSRFSASQEWEGTWPDHGSLPAWLLSTSLDTAATLRNEVHFSLCPGPQGSLTHIQYLLLLRGL
jgi:hypothetical protein